MGAWIEALKTRASTCKVSAWPQVCLHHVPPDTVLIGFNFLREKEVVGA